MSGDANSSNSADTATGASEWRTRSAVVAGVLSTLMTCYVTWMSENTKQRLDQADHQLRKEASALEVEIRHRVTALEESKDRVERLKWVHTLIPQMLGSDARQRSASLAMVRLALGPTDTEALLTGLAQSNDPQQREEAKQVKKDFEKSESSELVRLVDRMNADTADVRRAATGKLQHSFAAAPEVVGLVLDRLSAERVKDLNPNGLINSLYYLSRTDDAAWTPENIQTGNAAVERLQGMLLGEQATAELRRVERLIKRVRG